MKTNKMSNILKIVALLILIVGIIGSLILGDVFQIENRTLYYTLHTYNAGLAVAGVVSSILTSIFFYALAEIISLLQLNLDKNTEVSDSLNRILYAISGLKSDTNNPEHNLVIEDIEANLPQM